MMQRGAIQITSAPGNCPGWFPGPYETLGSFAALVFLGSRDPVLFSGSRALQSLRAKR